MSSGEEQIGCGGSGGGTDTNDHSQSYDGEFKISAKAVQMLSRPPIPPASGGPNVISLLATDLLGMGEDGSVDVKGANGSLLKTRR